MRHAVILGGGKSQRPYIQEFKNRGCSVTVIDRDPNSVSKPLADAFIENSIYELDSIIQNLTPLHEKNPISLVYSNSSAEAVAKNVAALNEHFLTPHPSFDSGSVARCYSKANMRKSMAAMGVNMAKEFSSTLPDSNDFPVIAKPISGGIGGFGVCKINTLAEFHTLQKDHSNIEWLIEETIEGEEYSVDGIVVGNALEIISICKKSSGEYRKDFIPDRFQLIPSPKDSKIIDFDLLHSQSTLAVKALKINNSQVSLDIKITPDRQLFIIECGLFWDAKIDRLWEFAGFNPYQYFIGRVYCNGTNKGEVQNSLKEKTCSMDFLYTDTGKTFYQAEIRQQYPDDYIEFERNDGDQVKPPTSVADLLACRFYG